MQHYHPHARLTTHGRARLLHAVASGTPVADACADAGVSRTTYYHWRQRFASEGLPGLADRSSRPRCPRMALTPAQEQAITVHRIKRGWGPDRIALVLRLPRATVHRAIVRLGLRRTRVPAPPAARYERAGPGDLVHIDTKKLGRIIGGPGHRVTGDRRSRSRGAGWTVIHAAIDDATRVAYVELLPDECGVTASGFLRRMVAHFRRLGIPVQRVLTDNGSQYVSGVWKAACADLGVGARRTRPYRPQTNGKVERWFQTVLRECLYLHPLASEDERQRALDTFVEYYNHDRPHLGIKGLTPISRLASLSTTL